MATIVLKKMFNNEDIIRHICSFGYPEYRTHLTTICSQIKSNHAKISEKLSNEWEQCQNYNSLTSYIGYVYPRKDILEMYYQYKKCHCCTRHSHYKPDIIRKKVNKKPRNSYYTTTEDCLCDCRHMTRHLYHGFWYQC